MFRIRTPYNYDTDLASYQSGLKCTDPTRTQQQFKDEADINNIIDKFMHTGLLPGSVRMPQYADFIEATNDFQSAMNAIRAAEESFAMMPSRVRERFQNNPQRFLEFCEDPRNADEARKLGLTRMPLSTDNPAATPATTEPKEATP